jgi:hypothetical protein
MGDVKVPQEWPIRKKVRLISTTLISIFILVSILILVN